MRSLAYDRADRLAKLLGFVLAIVAGAIWAPYMPLYLGFLLGLAGSLVSSFLLAIYLAAVHDFALLMRLVATRRQQCNAASTDLIRRSAYHGNQSPSLEG